MIAKFLGLALYKIGPDCLIKFGANCGGIVGSCCEKHRLEGLKEAHELFPKILEPFGIKIDKIDSNADSLFMSLLAVYADFKTQIIVSDFILNSSNTDSLSHHLESLLETFYGPCMNSSYLKTKLQQRAVDLRRILENPDELEETMRSKYPIDLFESNLKNMMKNIYDFYPATFLNEMLQKRSESENENIKRTSNNNNNNNLPVAVQEPKPVKISAPTKPKSSINLNNNNTTSNNSPFKDVIISGRFFRGILEPIDERFAAIIEGHDVNVKQYYALRENQANDPLFVKKVKSTDRNDSVNNSSVDNNRSLLSRHDSAERISWETQEQQQQQQQQQQQVHAASVSNNSSSPSQHILRLSRNSRGRRRFTDQETSNLIEGVRRFGRDWRRILDTYDFDGRSNVDLKDKARNLEKLGLL